MKLINAKHIALALVAAAFAFGSCSDGETYDVVGNPDNLVYFKANADNTFRCNVIHTVVGTSGKVEASFPVLVQREPAGQLTATIAIDNTLVEAYNAQNGTDYKPLPDGLVEISNGTLTLDAANVEQADSVTVAVKKENLSEIADGEYLVPVRVANVEGGGKGSLQRGVGYIIVNCSTKDGLINEEATTDDMRGTKLSDYSSWTCLEATGMDKGAFQDLFAGGWYSQWPMDDTKGSFVVDLQKQRNVCMVGIGSPVLKSVELSFSTDNKLWNEIGSVAVDKMVSSSDLRYAVLYAAQPCRYLKVEVALDETQQWIEYYKYLTGLEVYEE